MYFVNSSFSFRSGCGRRGREGRLQSKPFWVSNGFLALLSNFVLLPWLVISKALFSRKNVPASKTSPISSPPEIGSACGRRDTIWIRTVVPRPRSVRWGFGLHDSDGNQWSTDHIWPSSRPSMYYMYVVYYQVCTSKTIQAPFTSREAARSWVNVLVHVHQTFALLALITSFW